MPFTLRIEIQGLFRFVTEGGNRPHKLTAVAPWVLPGDPPDWLGPDDDEKRKEVKPHQLVVSWQPRQLGHNVPLTARTLVPLTGQQLSFKIDGGHPEELEIPETLRIPRLFAERSGQNTGIFDPEDDLGKAVTIAKKVLAPYLTQPSAGEQAGNEERVMGRIVIDRGTVLTDEPVGVVSRFERPHGSGVYSGDFTNRIAIVVRGAKSVELFARNLVRHKETDGPTVTMTGVKLKPRKIRASGGRLGRPAPKRLNISVLHFCPEFLLKKCPGPMDDPAEESTDQDFRWLYQLSQGPEALKDLPPGALPAPKRFGRPHTCEQWECGCTVEPGGRG